MEGTSRKHDAGDILVSTFVVFFFFWCAALVNMPEVWKYKRFIVVVRGTSKGVSVISEHESSCFSNTHDNTSVIYMGVVD